MAATNPVKLSTSVGKRVILFFNVLRCSLQDDSDDDMTVIIDFKMILMKPRCTSARGIQTRRRSLSRFLSLSQLQYDCHGSFLLFSDFRHIHTQHLDCFQEGVKMSQSDSILTDMTHVLSPCLDLRSPLHSISEDDYDCGPMPDMTHMTIS